MKVIITDSLPQAKLRKPGSYMTWKEDKIVDILKSKDCNVRFHYNSSGEYLNLKIITRCNDHNKLDEIIEEIVSLCLSDCIIYIDDDKGYCYIDTDSVKQLAIPSDILCRFTDYFVWGLED